MKLGLFGGLERIRTAVGAFAELSLATRPRDQIGCSKLESTIEHPIQVIKFIQL